MKNFDELIYDYVRLVPLGMVTTFSEIAKVVDNGVVSNNVVAALKKVQDVAYIPAHRVVKTSGDLSKSFIDGGKRGQKKLLKSEGVVVKGGRVDLRKFGFRYW